MPIRRARSASLATALAVALVAATANAQGVDPSQLSDPYALGERQTEEARDTSGLGLDTEYTPRAKEVEGLWEQIAGTPFGSTEPMRSPAPYDESSQPSFDIDFFDVSFRNARNGIAVGARCLEAPAREAGESDAAYGTRVAECTRVPGRGAPVIYRFTERSNESPTWREVELGGSAERAGYAGAAAWIDSDTALVVGGTGAYPRRDPAYSEDGQDPGEPYGANKDPAGVGRAWLHDPATYGDEGFHELDLSRYTAPCQSPTDPVCGMRGFSALDFHPGQGRVFGAAGALGQIWHWEGAAGTPGTFSERIDSQSPSAKLFNRGLFQFRVREIRFVPEEEVHAFGVTAGCCAPTPLQNAPRLIAFDQEANGGPRWYVRKFQYDSLAGPTADRDASAPAVAGGPTTEEPRRLRPEQTLPDSLYSLLVRRPSKLSEDYCLSALATPGGEQDAYPHGERSSLLTVRIGVGRGGAASGNLLTYLGNSQFMEGDLNPLYELARDNLSTARLVAADGDTGYRDPLRFGDSLSVVPANPDMRLSSCPNYYNNASNNAHRGRDAFPDWLMGELRSTRIEGLGARGLARASHLRPTLIGETLDADADQPDTSADPSSWVATAGLRPGPAELLDTAYEPTSADRLDRQAQSHYFALTSYSVNAIDMVGPYGEEGVGWAVGDHGAILQLSDKATKSQGIDEPAAPRLGSRRPRPLPSAEPFAAARPAPADEVGPVPALASRPREALADGRLVPAGAPDPTRFDGSEDVTAMTIARDGAEGWAIGARANTGTTAAKRTTLYRYDGSSWSRCDPLGIPGQLPADPPCEGLAGLRRFNAGAPGDAGEARAANLTDVARVPTERDADPTNDDEFEAVAVGESYREGIDERMQPVIARYSGGRWNLEEPGIRAAATSDNDVVLELASVAFTAPDDGWILGSSNNRRHLYHFDGERWIDCDFEDGACGSPGARLGANARLEGVVSAGDRVYAFGHRAATGQGRYPLIAYHERGTGSWVFDAAAGAYDPGFGKAAESGQDAIASSDPDLGQVSSLAVAQLPGGGYEGWAVGGFGGVDVGRSIGGPKVDGATFLRLVADGSKRWEAFANPGAAAGGGLLEGGGAFLGGGFGTDTEHQIVTIGASGAPEAFITEPGGAEVLSFDRAREQWVPIPTARPPGGFGAAQAMAPDGQGGFWLVGMDTGGLGQGGRTYFHHYTPAPHRPVFDEVPHAFTEADGKLSSLAGAADGTVWAATDGGALARYDRIGGWARVQVPGWDPGRVVTRASAVNAVAVAADGGGIAVGEDGRIADLSPAEVRLDAAAGTLCANVGAPPCGTGRDLRSAAVAPDGSAVAGGDRLALLWRPAGGDFRAIDTPEAPVSATIAGVSLPTPDRAYLALDTGAVFSGRRAGQSWSWTLENLSQAGELLALDAAGEPLALRSIAVDASGHGYAVGDGGLVLERVGEGVWRRLDTGFLDSLTSVTLARGEGGGALIGGLNGVVLTVEGGEVELARPADYFTSAPEGQSGDLTGRVVGAAVLPGVVAGQTEAWVGVAGTAPGTGQMLHYASDPAEPLLDPQARAEPLPDAPKPGPGELSFAAFGKTECPVGETSGFCQPMDGSNITNEVLARRVTDEIIAASRRPGGPSFSVFTGDAIDTAGLPAADVASPGAGLDGPQKLSRWNWLVAERLDDGGVPLYGAIGAHDLSEACVADFVAVFSNCVVSTRRNAGENTAWRQAMLSRPGPWGAADLPTAGAVTFEEVPGSDDAALEHSDTDVDADGEAGLRSRRVPTGGASTHYAVDIEREGEPITRLVVADNSLRALATSDPIQQPLESAGQAAWLERMLCEEGTSTSTGERCTRRPGQHAIVLATTPTYTYGPGPLDTATDAAVFEQLLLENDASVVVSGRLGWNGLYFARGVGGAPVDHAPGPGGAYPAGPPDPLPAGDDPLPFVVASGAAGKFGPDGQGDGSAADGYWHGYSIVRLDASGDRAKTIVEQRPVLDWVRISPRDNILRPRQSLDLTGLGREPISIWSGSQTTRYDEVSSPAITHRYDLLLADPERPWLPCKAAVTGCELLRARLEGGPASEGAARQGGENPCAPYLCLPERIGTIDRHTGETRAGDGRYPATFAIAMLSVGEKVASHPLVFDKAPSFVVKSTLRTPGAPPVDNPPTPKPPAQPPIPDVPSIPKIEVPAIPPPPAIPNLSATAPPEPQPPAPPAPPPPSQQPAPLDLSVAPPGVSISTPTALIQPPTPPVNPAPPGGARREARQRQAAAQKGGADSNAEEQASDGGGDMADAPRGANGAQMTRLDHSFTALPRERASGGAPAVLYGGGITLAALALALSWSTMRPGPRRREPHLPAPAWQANRRRWR